MDWLTFTAEVIKAVVWPTTIIATTAMLKEPLKQLLGELIRFKWKDLEIEFDKEIKRVKIEADKLPPADKVGIKLIEEIRVSDSLKLGANEQSFTTEISTPYQQLAELYPAAAIVQAWLVLENTFRKAVDRIGVPGSDQSSPEDVAHQLSSRGYIEPATLSIFVGLWNLRNKALRAGATDLTTSQALEFEAVTRRLASVFVKLWKEPLPKVTPRG